MGRTTSWYLSMHVPYACRHSGACCSSGWDIPIEASRVPAIERARRDGRIGVPMQWLRSTDGMPADVGGILATGAGGSCVFHHDHACAIHAALGHGAIPLACQHFPRVCLIDPRGVFVTLSHYCPTAASLLFTAPPTIEIVEGPPPLPGQTLPEGLDAREALPPLLTPEVLMDVDSFGAWERHMVEILAAGHPPEEALDRLAFDAARLCDWRPGSRRLMEAVDDTRRASRAHPSRHQQPDWEREIGWFDMARASIPEPHAWPALSFDVPSAWRRETASAWAVFAPVIGRYLAAQAFASWVAYQGNGLQTLVSSLRLALAVLRIETLRACREQGGTLDAERLTEGLRRADLLLLHFADRQTLATHLGRAGSARG